MAITKTVLIPSLPSSAPAAKWPTLNNRANAPSMPKRLTCDIDSSRYLGLAACAGWRSVEHDRGDHRATVQGIAGMCGSTVKGMLLFDEWEIALRDCDGMFHDVSQAGKSALGRSNSGKRPTGLRQPQSACDSECFCT